MRTTLFAVIAATIALTPNVSHACSYSEPRTFKSALQDANSVFVFQLRGAKYKRKELGNGAYFSWVEGEIFPVQNLYGNPANYRTIQFSTDWCGGVNLVVGHYYLIATSATGSRIELTRADGSLYDLGGFFSPSNTKANLKSPLIFPVVKAIYKVEALPSNFPPRWVAALTVIQPPPPPPLTQR